MLSEARGLGGGGYTRGLREKDTTECKVRRRIRIVSVKDREVKLN